MKINKKEILIPTISLFIICLVVTALLAVTNKITAPLIAEISAGNAAAERQVVLPAADSFEQVDYTNPEGKDIEVYAGYSADGLLSGFVFTVNSEKGYGGAISVMVGIDISGTVTGVSILDHDETPGLGANTTKSDFLDQYKQTVTGDFAVTKDGGNIDAVTGATISSRAVTRAVNVAYDTYCEILSTGGTVSE